MATSGDLWRLITILDEEGFGFVAAEILNEISRGRAPEDDEPDDETGDAAGASSDSKRSDRSGEENDDPPTKRMPIAAENQLGEAVRLLGLLLVEPARHLAEAERLAGELMDREPVHIVFVDAEGLDRDLRVDRLPAGDSSIAERLEKILAIIAERPGEVPS